MFSLQRKAQRYGLCYVSKGCFSVSHVEGPGSMSGWAFMVRGEQSGFRKGFSPSYSLSHVNFHSIIASYSFVYRPAKDSRPI